VTRAQRLADRVRGAGGALALARALLSDTWVVDDLGQLPPTFAGVAVTRNGRVWSPGTRELRQAPAVGEERVLAERNRREQLIRASETAARAELSARAESDRLAAAATQAESRREQATASHRAAVRAQDEAAEERRRLQALITQRRSAPDDGPDAGRRAQLAAQLAAEDQMLGRAERERGEREARIVRLELTVARDQQLVPAVRGVIEAIERAAEAISGRLGTFEAALVADRQAGEHVAGELRSCAAQEATLYAQLQRENESLTEAEVRLQRSRDQDADARAELQALAARLELAAELAEQALTEAEREGLRTRLERLERRREQLGPVNPLAQDEYEEALAHVEELEAQRVDLETALRELERLISDTDRQIREAFERTFEATAKNFEELAAEMFPGGNGRLRLVTERDGPARVLGGQSPRAGQVSDGDPDGSGDELEEPDSEPEEDRVGVEIEITPAGKECKRLTLLSGGEKSMTALAFLFAVFLARPCPFYILDEVEPALDDLNIDRFLSLLRTYSTRAQFIVVTHQKRTMEAADSLYGVSMGGDGISKVISRRLPQEQAAGQL
jgi:chromosome segregation protein